MKKILCCVLLLALLIAPCALANNNYDVLSNCDILRRGNRGDSVRRLQQALIDMGYLNGKADGAYGPATESAVYDFQWKNGISASGVATMFTQAKLFGNDAMKAWNNNTLYNRNSGEYWVSNVNSCGQDDSICLWFDFVNRDYTPVEAICIYYWLADSRNNLVKRDGWEYQMQWYYGMSIPFGESKSVEHVVPIPGKLWGKFATVRCVVGEIAYTDGTVVVTMNASKAPYENRNYILSEYH